MKVVNHPYLVGVRCREDGACFVPANGKNKAHWTLGTKKSNGYREVCIARKKYLVHRLMAETFLQCPIPDGMQIDHIDRCPMNNAKDNIRIVTPSENQRNRGVNDESFRKYGVVAADDKIAYNRALLANNPEYRERRKKYMHDYYEAHKAHQKRAKPAP